MYFEDVDLCWRLARSGWSIGYTDVVTVVHLGSASWGDRIGAKRYARDTSQIRYFLKHGHQFSAIVARLRRTVRRRWTSYYAGSTVDGRQR